MKLSEIIELAEAINKKDEDDEKSSAKDGSAAPPPAATTGTTTSGIAPFQHRLGIGTVRRPKPKNLWGAKGKKDWDEMNAKQKARRDPDNIEKSSGKKTTQELNAGHYVGAWTTKQHKPYDHPLNKGMDGELSSEFAPQMEATSTDGISTFTLRLGSSDGPIIPDDAQNELIDWNNHHDKATHKHGPLSKMHSDNKIKPKKKANESTTVAGVATTDTRLGGASFEPVFLEKDSPTSAIKNELKFYRSDPVDFEKHGYKYAFDTSLLKDKTSGKTFADLFKKSNLELDPTHEFPVGSYHELLKRLSKAHNI
jgi:hypothetical protein